MNWQPIATAPRNKYVLVARDSGYIGYPWCYEVAQFTAGYHDRWDSVSNDAIEPQPLYWCELPTPPCVTDERNPYLQRELGRIPKASQGS
jgi:hypothetical protein